MSHEETFEMPGGFTADEILLKATRLKRQLTDIADDFKEIAEQGRKAVREVGEIPLFKGMLRTLEREYDKFQAIWTELRDLDAEQGVELLIKEEDRALRAEIRKYFQQANSYAESILITSRISGSSSTRTSNQSNISRVKAVLPAIPIPSFDGQRTKWRAFRDIFDPLINQDDSLSDAEKFHYLRGALRGTSAACIAKLALTNENYNIPWRTLNLHFDNPRLLASAYVDPIIQVRPY